MKRGARGESATIRITGGGSGDGGWGESRRFNGT